MSEEQMARRKLLESLGLHFCRRFGNLVMYNEKTCIRCPFSTKKKRINRS